MAGQSQTAHAMQLTAAITTLCAALWIAAWPAEAADKDLDRATLDQDEAIATKMHQLAHAHLQQIGSEVHSLGDRIASETVNKPWFDNPNAACRQKACWGAMSGNGDLSFEGCKPPLEPTAYSGAQFDDWFEVEQNVIAQAERELDQAFQWIADLIKEKRTELDNTDAGAALQGGEWKAARHTDIMRSFGFADYLKYSYLNVIDSYALLINLGLINIGGGRSTFGPPPPPGLACLLSSSLSIGESQDQIAPQQYAIQAAEALKAGNNAGREAVLGLMKQALAKCAQGEERRRDAAALQLRQWRDRFFEDREDVRLQMLKWRQEAIDAGLFAGTGDAAIAEVYGTPADLDPRNVFGNHLPWVLGAPIGNTAKIGAVDQVRNPEAYGLWPLIQLEDICIQNVASPQKKYEDLEPESAFELKILESSKPIIDGIASGADDQEHP